METERLLQAMDGLRRVVLVVSTRKSEATQSSRRPRVRREAEAGEAAVVASQVGSEPG